jgi:hypothetical protein
VTRVRKQLPIADSPDEWNERIRCNWDDCENPASNLNRAVICHAAAPYRHSAGHVCQWCEIKTFCRVQHKDFWARSHLPGQYGRLGAGINAVYL